MKVARELLGETTAYVRLAASLEISGAGWPRETAVLVGNMVRLSKLLISIDTLAALKLTEMLALTIPLAIETMVDLKYLIENRSTKLFDSYVGIAAKRRSKVTISWADLDLKQKAEAVGFGDIYTYALQDAPSHLHGSWKDLTEYHLTAVGDERYRADLSWTEANPRSLLAICMHALVATQAFSDVIGSGPVMDKLQKSIEDLQGRLRVAGEAFDKWLYKRWW
jgi:hypothetical protein